ncbi:hypothetical protein BCR34DRAFT_74348 [Clohesyomyces aquaticus]|uniref:MYND-type domain-containing protein n=1 Tax=Clohesyomyces aquaticus TaxID=1231657 RepID=A0A1Y2A395_9PLEO|nr:hypothetical protein BCR34DRAFT_74348 [Clohesyomyces aquaticus]
MCANPSTLHYGSCGNSIYCSKECQKSDWPKHKLLCKQMADFPDSVRPASVSPDSYYRRAIYFDPSQVKPSFVWLEVRKQNVGGAPYWIPFLDHLMSRNKTNRVIEYIGKNLRTGRNFNKVIQVWYRDHYFNGSSVRNQGIMRAIDLGLRDVAKEWRGPMVFRGLEEYESRPGVQGVDMNASDMRHNVGFLHSKARRATPIGYKPPPGWTYINLDDMGD